MEGKLARQQKSIPATYSVREFGGRSLFRLGRKSYSVYIETDTGGSSNTPREAWTRRGAIRSAEKRWERIHGTRVHQISEEELSSAQK